MDVDVHEFTLELEKWFLETPVDTLAQWLDWTGDTVQAELMEAKRFVDEVRLLSWVQSQNCIQGVSPLPQFVWEQRCLLSIENGSEYNGRTSSQRPHRTAGAKKWLQRFRRRWGLAMGRLPAKDLLPVDAMREKVRSMGVRKIIPFPNSWGPKRGPANGPCLGSPSTILNRVGVQKAAPSLN